MHRNDVKGLLPASVKRLARRLTARAVLGPHPYGGPADSPVTFVAVCRRGFDINVPNANSTYRLGLSRGFAQIGVRYQLVDVFDVVRLLPQQKRPFILLSIYDYMDLSAAARKTVRQYPHFIWVNPWFKELEEVYAKHRLPDPRLGAAITRVVLESGASFVWAPVPPSCLRFYDEWRRHGLRVESLLQACDTGRYFPERNDHRYADAKVAFVGGYWAYKALQFDKYLKPYKKDLTVFGYQAWPYGRYGGLLPDADERVLYQNARVCPALSEPHAEVMGDIVERIFKVMGSGGLAITDVTPFYREAFAADELFVPSTVAEYHDFVRQAIVEERFGRQYRENGYRAILARHTYAHRARRIMELLGVSCPTSAVRGFDDAAGSSTAVGTSVAGNVD